MITETVGTNSGAKVHATRISHNIPALDQNVTFRFAVLQTTCFALFRLILVPDGVRC